MKLTDEDMAHASAMVRSRWASELSQRDADLFLAGKRAGALATRERAAKAATDEPEFPDEMPDELWKTIRGDRATAAEALRSAVRLTKSGIEDRIRALEVDDE